MAYWFAANAIVFIHLLFVCYVLLGALLVLKWRWTVFLHLPAATWGALVEFQGWYCPLTPLENQLRLAAGEAGYTTSFIEHYIFPILYPAGLNQDIQTTLGIIVVSVNLLIYSFVLWRYRKT